MRVYYSGSSANAGDFQTNRGRNNNNFSRNPNTAFPATYGTTAGGDSALLASSSGGASIGFTKHEHSHKQPAMATFEAQGDGTAGLIVHDNPQRFMGL